MRKLLALLLLACAGYYLYRHQDIWNRYASFFLGKPFAWKVVSRDNSGTGYLVRVELVNRNRWRVEAKGTSKMVVAVSDGSDAVCNILMTGRDGAKTVTPSPGAAAKLDPRLDIKQILQAATKISVAAPLISPQITEECDGHTCWRSTMSLQGATVVFWVDTTSHFPVRLDGKINGKQGEFHFSALDPDLVQRSAEVFDTHSNEPLFTDYLTTSVRQAPPPSPEVTLTMPVQMPVSIRGQPSGTVTLPPGTRLQMISADKDSVVVGYGDSTLSIPANSTDLRKAPL